MKSFIGFLFFLFSHYCFGQVDVFKEQNVLISNKFENSELLKERSISDRYDQLTRSEGFLVNEVSVMGSVYTKMLHRSGKVIFNCPANDYLNQIKSLLLTDYPHLDELIHVYVTEDPSHNAFATVNNNVYVNIGLLARIENEAQLAFILSHEIMHIVDAHQINSKLEINKTAKVYTKSNVGLDNQLLVLRQHEMSREFEIQADLDGFTLYLKQNYDPKEALKAMKLLENADEYTTDIHLTKETLFFADAKEFETIQNKYITYSMAARDSVLKRKEKLKLKNTHPSIEERLVKMSSLIDSVDSRPEARKKYIINEQAFNPIRMQARSRIHVLFAEEMDFVSLFLYTSSELNDRKDFSNSNLNYLGYAIQGLLFDHNKKHRIGSGRSANPADSLFSYFYKSSSKDQFAKWSYHAIDTLADQFPDNKKLSRYKEAIVRNILTIYPKNLTYIFGADSLFAIGFKGDTLKVNGLNQNKIEFEVSSRSDMSRKRESKYNAHNRFEEISTGKLGIIGVNLIHIRKKDPLTQDYVVDLEKVELMERHSDKVCENLEQDFDNQVVSFIPNPLSYTGLEYEKYDVLNKWLSECLYFNSSNYVSIYEEEVSEIRKKDDIKYLMSSVNIGVKSFSSKSFIAAYMSPVVMPIYLPQLIAHVVGSSTRKYQLSLVFDLESGGLIYWDRRTYLDANSLAQLQVVNNDIIKNFFHEK